MNNKNKKYNLTQEEADIINNLSKARSMIYTRQMFLMREQGLSKEEAGEIAFQEFKKKARNEEYTKNNMSKQYDLEKLGITQEEIDLLNEGMAIRSAIHTRQLILEHEGMETEQAKRQAFREVMAKRNQSNSN